MISNIKVAAFAAGMLVASVFPASAQIEFRTPAAGQVAIGVQLLCQDGSANAVPCSVGAPLPINGTISATLGGFTPSASGARGTPITVTVADSSGTLPTGTVIDVSNVGANPMYCNVNGIAATTSDKLIASNSWFEFTIPPAVTTLHCIATGGSTTANLIGGAGLGTGAGGGAAGGGGGSVTQGTSPWVVAGNIASGSADSGSPVKTGGVFNTSPAALASGNRGDTQLDSNGNTRVTLAATFGSASDAVSNAAVAFMLPRSTQVQALTLTTQAGYGFNGTTWDRQRTVAGDAQAGTGILANAPMMWNGTTYDRLPGTTAGLLVNPGTLANWGITASTQNGATPTNAQLSMGQFNTAPTTITSGNVSPLQIDSGGKLLVNCTGCSSSGSITSWGGGTLGAMANYGTSPGAVLVPGINAFITNTVPVTLTSTTVTGTVAVTQSGAWSLSANQSVNTAQINGVTPLMGNGVTGTGSQRVTIASDNTAFAVNATLQASAATAIGKVDPNTIGIWGLQVSTQNSATPTNGGLVLGQFNTAPTTITSGNVSPLQMDNAGNLLVNIKAGSSSGAVAQGSTTSGQTGGLTQAAVLTSAPTYTTGQTNPLTMDTSGALRVNVTTALGLTAGSTTSGQTGSMIMGAVTTAAPGYTTAQTNYLSLTTAGGVRTDLASVNGTTALTGGVNGSVGVGGLAANGASASGNPVPAGAVAETSESVVTAGQAAALVTDLARKLIVLPYANPENFVSGSVTTAMTGTTSTSLVAAPAAGLRNYITSCTFSNEHATVGTSMILQDGSGGTTIWTAPAAAVFGGAQLVFPTPLRQPTTATALFIQNVTTGASTKASCAGYKGA